MAEMVVVQAEERAGEEREYIGGGVLVAYTYYHAKQCRQVDCPIHLDFVTRL